MSEEFHISQALVDRMFEVARAETPREACGMIGGKGLEATHLYPVQNVDTSNVTYTIDPQEAFSVIRQMREDGVDFIACYHSHPATEPYPSPTDRAKSAGEDLIYVIISLRRPGNSEIRAYRLGEEVVELAVQIN